MEDITSKKPCRVLWLDILRIICTCAVILLHVSAWDIYSLPIGRDFAISIAYNAATRFGVPVFFMISGAVWLDPQKDISPRYLAKHTFKLLLILIFWNAFYYFYDSLVPGGRGFTALGQYHLLFLYPIIGLYLLVPLLRKITVNRQYLWYLVLLSFAASCLLPVLRAIPWTAQHIYPYYNALVPQSFSGAVLYFMLGYVLRDAPLSLFKRIAVYTCGAASLAITIIGTYMISKRTGALNELFFDYYFPTTFFEAAAVYVLCRQAFSKTAFRANSRVHRTLAVLSSCSFGVFLCHDLIIQLSTLAEVSPAVFSLPASIPLFALIIAAISFLLSYLLGCLPLLRFAVGNRTRHAMSQRGTLFSRTSVGIELLGLGGALAVSLFQVIVTWTRNARSVELEVFQLNIMIAAVLMLILYAVIRLLTGDALLGLLVSVPTFEFLFYYMHIEDALTDTTAEQVLLACGAGLIFLIVICCLRSVREKLSVPVKRKILIVLCTVSFVAIVGNLLVQIPNVSYALKFASRTDKAPVLSEAGPVNAALKNADRPNIYLVILDEYARSDMMEKQFGYDNSAFDRDLEQRAFGVSQTGENEIAVTDIQSANLINLDYVSFTYELKSNSKYSDPASYRTHAYLFDLLRANGYTSIAVDNTNEMYGYGQVNADRYLDFGAVSPAAAISFDQNEVDYMNMLWGGSVLHAVNRVWTALWGWMDKQNAASIFDQNVGMVEDSFAFLQNYEPQEEPTFVYAHILCPHLPFAFYPDGTTKDPNTVSQGWTAPNAYTDNVQYASHQILLAIDHILENDPDCVFILLSDHGARIALAEEGSLVDDYLPILNAVYYRGEAYTGNNGLSGVNTVRRVLSDALQIDLPLRDPPQYRRKAS